MNKKICFYVEGDLSIIDTVNTVTGLSFYQNETLRQIKKRYPKAELVPLDYAIHRIEEAAKERWTMLQPEEITEGEYLERLEVLPPEDFLRDDSGASFKMSEREYLDITTGFVAKDGKFYKMYVKSYTPHESMIKAVEHFINLSIAK
ncbi:MAG: hypothetical protein HC880_00815 [Bacteroidia bacterium]|nr:hypothetical protein [Bacteroidia bacterium]